MTQTNQGVDRWLVGYTKANADLLDADPEFRRWLLEDYRPIAGGWQY